MRIVIVEDDAFISSELARTLPEEAGNVIVAAFDTAAAATAWLRENPAGWDLAIVDMFLKQGHGFDVLKHCRRLLPQQRAVMFSNYSRDPAERQAKAAGADRFFDKAQGFGELMKYCATLAHASACASGVPAASREPRSSQHIASSASSVARLLTHAGRGGRI
jgi:DNA-binding NarL/FixJ family response regulator